MKRSNEHHLSPHPHKIAKRDIGALESLEKDALIDRILKTTGELNEVNEVIDIAKQRETFWRQKVSEKEKELKELTKERNTTYYGGISQGPSHRDQHIDPFFYEGFLSMKDKLAARDKEIAENQEIINSLETSEDSEFLLKMLRAQQLFAERVRANKKTLKIVAKLESNLEMIRTALRTIRQEKRDQITEIAERDAKIAELYKELSSLRGAFTDESASSHSGDKESAKMEVADLLDEKPLFEENEEDNGDVNVENNGIDVDISVLHRVDDEDTEVLIRNANDDRSVSVGENGTLKITV